MARDLFEYHPVIGYRFIPHLTARVRHEGGGYLIEANNLGFRQSSDVAAPRIGRPRVLVFGDSYTAGDGVSNRARYTDQVAALLPDMEILNFGLPGSGTDQQYLAWQEYGRSLDYDLVVIAPMVENIVRNTQSHRVTMNSADGKLVERAKPWFSIDAQDLTLHNNPVPRMTKPVQGVQASAQPASTTMLQQLNVAIDKRIPGFKPMTQKLRRITWPTEYNEADNPAWLLMQRILSTWIAESTAPVIMFPIPTFGHIEGGIDPKPYQRRYSELCEQTGARMVDPLPAFLTQNLDQRRLCRFGHDEHPTPLGHKILASVLRPAIQDLLKP